MLAVTVVDPAARRRADLDDDRASVSASCTACAPTSSAHLQRQSIAFFTRTRSGEVQSRLTHDISGMQAVITSTATSIASNVTTAVATAVAMVALSPRLSLLSLLVIPPAVWMTRRVALIRRDITARRQRRLADLHSQVEEALDRRAA